jgi:hypothetical protein
VGRTEDGFYKADEEADGDDLVRGLGGRDAESEHRPDELAGRDPPARSDFGEDYLGGQLADNVTGGPGHVDEVQLVGVHG